MARAEKPRILDANQAFTGAEPSWKDTDLDFIKANHRLLVIKTLNWYAANSDAKSSLNYFKKYFPKAKPTHTITVGFLCRMVARGYPKDLLWDSIENLAAKLPMEVAEKKQKEVKEISPKLVQIDPIPEAVNEKLDYYIDDILMKRSINPSFSVSGFNKVQLENVKKFATKQLAEFDGCSEKEEYGLSKRQENAIVSMIRKLLLQIQTESPAEKPRKTRTPKAIPIERIVKGFMSSDFGSHKTVQPAKLHNSSIAVLFDSAIRRVSVFVAEEGKLLSIKGRSVINFDESKSFSKILRKPEEQLSIITGAAKTNIVRKMNEIKAASGLPKHRSNETTTILKVW